MENFLLHVVVGNQYGRSNPNRSSQIIHVDSKVREWKYRTGNPSIQVGGKRNRNQGQNLIHCTSNGSIQPRR